MTKDDNVHQEENSGLPEYEINNRSCTDCICCIIYIIFLGAFIFVFAYGIANGDPSRFATIFDTDGKRCGHEADGTLDFPRGYLYQPLHGLTKAVCVKDCPTWTGETRVTKVDCYGEGEKFKKDVGTCEYSGDFEFNKLPGDFDKYFPEKFLIYTSKSYFGKVCLPTGITAASALNWAKNITIAMEAAEKFEETFDDLKRLWLQYLILAGIAIVLSMLSLLITRCCAGVFVWLIILLFLVTIFAAASFALIERNRLVQQQADQQNGAAAESNSTTTDNSNNSSSSGTTSIGSEDDNLFTFTDNFSSSYYNARNLKIASICLFVFGGICLLVVLFSISSIAVSIAVIKTASEFIASNCCIIFTPIIISIFLIIFIFAWIAGLVFLWSVGELEAGGATAFAKIKWDQKTKGFMVLYFFGLLWNAAFINYMTIFIVACTVAMWYFTYNKPESRPRCPSFKAFWWALRYHLGSLAFGAFLLAVIQFIKFLLMYVVHYVESLKKKGIENKMVTWILKCLVCCVSCFERLIKYISSLGYAYLAISRKNFCSSCANAFTLLVENPMKFGMVAAMGTVFAFIGKVFVASLTGVIGYFLIKAFKETYEELHSTLVPVVFFVILGYFVASIFFAVYGVAADSVIICFFYSKKELGHLNISAPASMQGFYDNYRKKDDHQS